MSATAVMDVHLWSTGTSHRIVASALLIPAALHATLYLDDPESRSHLVLLATFVFSAALRMYCGEWIAGERAVAAWNLAVVTVPFLPAFVCYATSSFLYIRTPEELMSMSFAGSVVLLTLTVAAPMPPRALASLVAGHLLMFMGNVHPPAGIAEMRKNAFLCVATSFGAVVGLVLRRIMIDAFRAADASVGGSDGVLKPREGPSRGGAPASATDASPCSSSPSSGEKFSWKTSLAAAATSDERRAMERVFQKTDAAAVLTPRVLAVRCSLDDVEMHAFVGAGAQGEVYLGAFKGGRAVACKRMHRMHMGREERIEQELRLLDLHLGLQHQNIVKLIAVAWDVETALLLTVMEFAQRGSLADLLLHGKSRGRRFE